MPVTEFWNLSMFDFMRLQSMVTAFNRPLYIYSVLLFWYSSCHVFQTCLMWLHKMLLCILISDCVQDGSQNREIWKLLSCFLYNWVSIVRILIRFFVLIYLNFFYFLSLLVGSGCRKCIGPVKVLSWQVATYTFSDLY